MLLLVQQHTSLLLALRSSSAVMTTVRLTELVDPAGYQLCKISTAEKGVAF